MMCFISPYTENDKEFLGKRSLQIGPSWKQHAMEIVMVKEHQDDSKECSCLSNKFRRLIFESDAFTLGLLCQCVNVGKAKLT